jgi:hypothetical protein
MPEERFTLSKDKPKYPVIGVLNSDVPGLLKFKTIEVGYKMDTAKNILLTKTPLIVLNHSNSDGVKGGTPLSIDEMNEPVKINDGSDLVFTFINENTVASDVKITLSDVTLKPNK